MKKLKIEWLYDHNDCDQCGGGYSCGAHVALDGETILNVPAEASCFESTYIEDRDILEALCEHLGIEIEGLE